MEENKVEKLIDILIKETNEDNLVWNVVNENGILFSPTTFESEYKGKSILITDMGCAWNPKFSIDLMTMAFCEKYRELLDLIYLKISTENEKTINKILDELLN